MLVLGQIQPRLKESFWEKIGFKNKKKEESLFKESKEKIDIVYKRLKQTVKSKYQAILLTLL